MKEMMFWGSSVDHPLMNFLNTDSTDEIDRHGYILITLNLPPGIRLINPITIESVLKVIRVSLLAINAVGCLILYRMIEINSSAILSAHCRHPVFPAS